MTGRSSASIEVWGGVECTVNRVQDRFFDQLARSGHLSRLDDIDRFADLGLKALRTPVLWEHAVDHARQEPRFPKVDPMLRRIRERGLRVIAGLCHHGSGPRGTDLLDPGFPEGLASYAERVARAYPFILAYTPVNEPLTTARFSALYGHWYPHRRDTASFLRALVHECRATVLAMLAIRKIVPQAQLVQTEDIAAVFATPGLSYQADYENERRFLSLDLLCGRVDESHPLYMHMLDHGISARELAWFLDNPCPPDIIAVNYYFTSDRFLDENLEKHPPVTHGGNGIRAYADIDTARAGLGLVGHQRILETVWDRYHLPLAIGEVHAGCTRDEQMRWVHEAFHGAVAAREAGVDVRAVTAWALLGSFDWNSLVCADAGVYESGLFDLRGTEPRPTALAAMIQSLATEGTYDHPVLDSKGWWRRLDTTARTESRTLPRPLLITGGGGVLAQALVRGAELRGLSYRVLTREELDVTDPLEVRECLSVLRPWAVINAAGTARTDRAEEMSAEALRVHARGPMVLAEEARARGCRFLTFSSDLVFAGDRRKPYVESDRVLPRSTFGRNQARAERGVLAIAPDALVVRTSGFFGPWDQRNLVARALVALAQGQEALIPNDAVISPTYLPDLVHASLDLLIDGAGQVWHLTNVGAVTWAKLARAAAKHANLPHWKVRPMGAHSDPLKPTYSVLESERGRLMPSLEDAVLRYLRAFSDTLLG